MTRKGFLRVSPVFFLSVGAVLLFFGGGCSAAPRVKAHTIVAPLEEDRQFVESWRRTYPESFKMIQRIVLTVRGRQYDFIGYLLMQRPGTFRALSMGEMGGRIFDFEASDGMARIVRKPESFPAEPLLDGVVGDILHLFGGAPPGRWQAARSDDGAPVVFWELNTDGILEYRRQAGQTRPEESKEIRSGRLVRKASYADWRAVSGWEGLVPARIVIENPRWGYQMEIELLSCEPIVPEGPLDSRDTAFPPGSPDKPAVAE